MLETILDYGQIIIADIVLSGDNALIIGMAAAGLAPELRKKAIIFGMVIAALMRVCLLYTSPSPRDKRQSRMPSSA